MQKIGNGTLLGEFFFVCGGRRHGWTQMHSDGTRMDTDALGWDTDGHGWGKMGHGCFLFSSEHI